MGASGIKNFEIDTVIDTVIDWLVDLEKNAARCFFFKN